MRGPFPAPERLAALTRLSAEINAGNAPPPIAEPVVIDESGWITLPVPHYGAPEVFDPRGRVLGREAKLVRVQLHAGMTLQWAPCPEQDGALIEIRGGAPDGDEGRDAVAVFLTRHGLAALITDLQAIAAILERDA